MDILGLSCYYHDSAACLIRDGAIVAAASEERFSRKKHDAGFPRQAVAYCLQEGGITSEDLDCVVFYDKPFLKFERLLETYVASVPLGLRSFIKAMPLWLKHKLWLPEILKKELAFEGQILFSEHHESHAASAFYPSPFDRAAFLTIDGVGEWTTTSYGIGENNRIRILSELHFPHSLGLLYSAFTYFTGFRVNSGEYKLMGLAPYGDPRYVDRIRKHLIDVREDGSFKLNMRYFTFPAGLTMTGRKFARLFDGPPRKAEGPITQREMDLARSIQVVTEDIVLRMVDHLFEVTGERNLCLAGGVALNCVANGRILRESKFDRIWIQPAAGDAGGALGAALLGWYDYGDGPRTVQSERDTQQGSYLGPSFSEREIADFLEENNIPHRVIADAGLYQFVATALSDGKTVGWFQGRMEFGPRALGNRSILADPRGKDVQRIVNLKIKFRESFRPFAPSVLREKANEYFELEQESPYMLLVSPVRGTSIEGTGFERLRNLDSPIPAVTHVDGTARIQTVSRGTNPRFFRLLEAFHAHTGCPVLVNTSFNVRGEPIVCTPRDAFQCFERTHLDVLVLGNHVIEKTNLSNAESKVFSPDQISDWYGLD